MKTTFLTFVLSLFLGVSFAQPTFSVGMQRSDFSEWEVFFDVLYDNKASMNSLRSSMMFGVGQLISLKNKSIVFRPNLTVVHFKKIYPGSDFLFGPRGVSFEMQQYDFNIATQLYLFDLIRNIRHPKSLQNTRDWRDFFYLLVSPGVSLVKQKYHNELTGLLISAGGVDSGSVGHAYFKESLGIGFDVYFPKKIKLSPFVTWNRIRNFSNQILIDQQGSMCPLCGLEDFLSEEDFIYFTFGLNVVLEFLSEGR